MMKHYLSIPAVLLVFVLCSCGEKVPAKEMMQARMAIARAESVKADKYAPEELDAAKKKLFACHDLIKKDESFDDVKKSAVESAKLGIEAYNKAIPLLAKDTMTEAGTSLQNAKKMYADELAKAEYDLAADSLKRADESYQNAKYYEAYQLALEADKNAKKAESTALAQKDVLKDNISATKTILSEAKQYNAEKFAPEQYRLAKENLDAAQNAYNAAELRKGFETVLVAKMNAESARLIAMEAAAKQKLEEADRAIAKGKKMTGKAGMDEMNAAEESLANAKRAFDEKNYKESISASEEAINLASKASGGRIGVARGADGEDQSAIEDKTDGKIKKSPGGEEVSEADGDHWTYKVRWRKRSKDCLWKISKKYYGTPWRWKNIFQANRDKIKNPNRIYPGQLLKVPKNK